MYIKVYQQGHQWFRDNGTLVGENADTYFNMYFDTKFPIIKTISGSYVRPIYGRLYEKTNIFVPLCEGLNNQTCVGNFCKAYLEGVICPRINSSTADGYYILLD